MKGKIRTILIGFCLGMSLIGCGSSAEPVNEEQPAFEKPVEAMKKGISAVKKAGENFPSAESVE
ncbi:hypothetical protein [uncultured Dubosiella sp.]|uniref:hypothetical protein n=1 Tax=uncultured Dubosiella sp. TaxID=1937011 RepID=UPI0025B2CCF6|nr:hypothetical protein [uncultured Dubosiella sp.]